MAHAITTVAKRALVCLAVLLMVLGKGSPVFSQVVNQPDPNLALAKPQPPMKNVFFNVLWGSVCGGMLLMGWATLDDAIPTEERYTFNRLSSQFLVGATYGGFLGLAAGIYFSIKGITFDENLSRIAYEPTRPLESLETVGAQAQIPPRNTGIPLVQYQFRF